MCYIITLYSSGNIQIEPDSQTLDILPCVTTIITPRACARGKAIGLYVCCHRRPHENRLFGLSRRLSD